jgi:hypothetical protein
MSEATTLSAVLKSIDEGLAWHPRQLRLYFWTKEHKPVIHSQEV